VSRRVDRRKLLLFLLLELREMFIGAKGSVISFTVRDMSKVLSKRLRSKPKSISRKLIEILCSFEDRGLIKSIARSRGKVYIVEKNSKLYELVMSMDVMKSLDTLLNLLSTPTSQEVHLPQNNQR